MWDPEVASGTKTFPETLQTGSHLYWRSSQVTVPAADFEANTYTCIVRHTAIQTQGGKRKSIESRYCTRRNTMPIRVHLIAPDCDAENTETNLELACILLSSGPGEAEVEWLINGVVEKAKVKVTLTEQDSHRYSSYISQNITKKSWDKGDHYTCRVTHPPNTQDAEMYNTSKCNACHKLVQVPTVSITKPSYRDLVDGTAKVTCLVEGFSLDKVQITWNVNGRPSTKPQAEIVKTGAGGAKSSHPVSLQEWEKGTTFRCTVVTMCLEEVTRDVTIKKDSRPCSDVQVHVETIPPTFADIYMTKSAKLTCRISNMPYDQDLKELNVTWTRKRDKTERETTIGQAMVQENNEFIYVDATATVCPEEWDSGDTFICKVTIPSLLPSAESRTLQKLKVGIPRAPAVYVLPPPSEQLALQETATVTCLAKGFYPDQLFVKWLRNDEPINDSEYFTSKPVQESKSPERYFTYSMLNVKEQDWSYGATYTCVVGHEALPLQTTQKTVDKKTAYLDVTVTVDDDEGLSNISSNFSTVIILFLVSLFYSATVTIIKVK